MVRTRRQINHSNAQNSLLEHDNTQTIPVNSPRITSEERLSEPEELEPPCSTTSEANTHASSPGTPAGNSEGQAFESDVETHSKIDDGYGDNTSQCSDGHCEPKLQEPAPATRRGHPAGSKNWQSWEERALAHEFREQELWKLTPGERASDEVWERLAAAIKRKNPDFDRTGAVCSSQFLKMIRREKKAKTRALQTTGEGKDIDDHCELMADLVSRLQDQGNRKEIQSKNAKAKALLEKAAGEEIRDAAMQGLVPRKRLTDVTKAEGATLREKSGQRNEHKRPTSPDGKLTEATNKPAKEARKASTSDDSRHDLLDKVQSRMKDDQAAIQEAIKLQQAQHDENRDAFNKMANSIDKLAQAVYEDKAQRAEESMAQRARDATYLSVIQTLSEKRS